MLIKEIIELLDSGFNPEVVFSMDIENQENVINESMIGKILSYKKDIDDPSSYEFIVDIGSYQDINKPNLTKTYFDKNEIPCLNYIEAGFCKNGKDTFFAKPEDELCSLTDSKQNKLYKRFKKENTNLTYAQWLEDKALDNKKFDYIDYKNVIEKLPHSKSKVPYVYHHEYLSGILNKPKDDIAELTNNTSDKERYATALCQIINESKSSIFLLINKDMFTIVKDAIRVCNNYSSKLKKSLKN